eukprot:TRINITY_DN2529_c0_g1_i1.p1 TRINITY_DN2529_c0_g1~~TRINITY_DN2529_c0_g1_i1.p1  ORF type:complete len:680 (-),score=57.61 TRINITY_DN2529_c0_g1_i1:58-2097(-)
MITPCSVAIFLSSWRMIALGNCLASIIIVIMYLSYFSLTQNGRNFIYFYKLVVALVIEAVIILGCTNFCTIFYYVYEKAFRKLHFMERKIQRVIFPLYLSQSKLRWKAVLDSLPVGVIIANNSKEIKHINQEMRFCAPNDSEPVCISINPCFETQQNEASLPSMESIKDRTDTTLTLRHLIEKRDDEGLGEQVYNMACEKTKKAYEVKTKYLPKTWPEGYKIVVVKDQTVYEQLVKERMVEKYQRMLLSSISHEIRNPLNAISGYNTMIFESGVEEKIHTLCNKIECAIQQVDLMLSGACDIMRSESNTSILKPQAFSLKNTIRQVVDIVMPNLESKPIALKVSIDPLVPDTICSDCKKYMIILFNLLMNAAKYTCKGKIKVKVEYYENTLNTKVEDTGIGIAAERLEKLFELYANIESVNPYNPQGMGLGLALCKKLSKTLGGSITAKSILGVGTTFTFTIKDNLNKSFEEDYYIPAENESINNIRLFFPKASSKISLLEKGRPAPELECTCAEVLIVDDEPSNRLVLKTYLASLELSYEEAENGRVAVEMVEERLSRMCCGKYKLILMDINMPEMDGTTATELLIRLFEKHKMARTPILAITAANLQTRVDIRNLLSVGFADISMILKVNNKPIVQKPVSKAHFVERVKPFIGGRQHKVIVYILLLLIEGFLRWIGQ